MRVHVIHAHPVETSFNRTLFQTACEALIEAGHEVDPLSLYDEDFDARLSRKERLNYHNVPDNVTAELRPFVDRLKAADALVLVHPIWNFGYPAILKGYFDRIFLPGVSFIMSSGGDRGTFTPTLDNIKKVAFVVTYGGTRWRAILVGDPPRLLAKRWAWATMRPTSRPRYLALYNMNGNSQSDREAFCKKVRTELKGF